MKETERNHKECKPLDEKNKDRGDNIKKQDNTKNRSYERNYLKNVRKPVLCDRGDISVKRVANPHKTVANTDKNKQRSIVTNKKLNDIKSKLNAAALPDCNVKNSYTVTVLSNKATGSVNTEDKSKVCERKANDKVNVKARFVNKTIVNHDVKNPAKSDLKNDRIKNQPILKSGSRDKILDSNKSEITKTQLDFQKKAAKDTAVHRKPMIQVVKSKNDNRVYKAVTFTEQNRVKPTVLEINIPNIQQPKKPKSKLVNKNVEAKIPAGAQLSNNKSTSKLSVITKTQNRRNRLTERTKRRRLNRCISSPDKFKKVESPPTEVAKWGPSCINAHTKPYYEAWVNTTLAAISKMSKKDKLFLEKQNIIKTLQRSLETGAESPELVHEDYASELYAGKIKITHKKLSKRQPLITPLLDKEISILNFIR